MRSWTTEVPINDDHGHQNTNRIHNEGKEQIFGNQWQHQRSWRQNLTDQEEKHDQRQKNADAQGDFLTGLRRKIEDEHAEKRNQYCRQYQVHRVE